MALLETSTLNNVAIYQWERLAQEALSLETMSRLELREMAVMCAIRCYEAIGQFYRVAYLKKVRSDFFPCVHLWQQAITCAEVSEEGYASEEPLAMILLLSKEWKAAESLMLKHEGGAKRLIEIYKALDRWDDAIRCCCACRYPPEGCLIRIAEQKRHPETKQLKCAYMEWLLATNQVGTFLEQRFSRMT